MPGLNHDLPPTERVVLAIDTSERSRAKELAGISKQAGAWVVKFGLEFSTATSWSDCSEIAIQKSLEWIADAKLDDISNTTAGAVRNFVRLDKPPVGITIHANSGVDSMRAAHEIASEAGVTMIAITHLTSIDDVETKRTYGLSSGEVVSRRAIKSMEAGLGAIVCSAQELELIKSSPKTGHLFTMVPGTRTPHASAGDQKRVTRPSEAVSMGADVLVIGREVTDSSYPESSYDRIVNEIDHGLRFPVEQEV